MYILIKILYIWILTKTFTSASGIVHMTQNSLNGAKFYEFRRSPQKIRDSFEIKASGNFTPTVICDSDQIGLALNENFADIRMFSADHSHHPDCIRRFSLELDPQFVTRIDGPCGVRRAYKGVPSSFVTYSIRLIVSHNSDELTEFDKIYDVTCSLHLKTMAVETSYDIISPQTTTISSSTVHSRAGPGPKCKYSLHHTRVGGPRTVSAHVGEVVYHRWKCAAPLYENNRQMPMLIFKVYACVVHDENNRTYAIIDDNGCSLDEEIIPTPEYDIENGVIYTPSKAFRFANSNHVHFKCMISVCSAVDPSCRNSVPPKCKNGLAKKKRRQLPEEMTIEQRLLRIHELMKVKRENITVEVGRPTKKLLSHGAVPLEVEEVSLNVVNREYEIEKLEHILRSYQIWTWILCVLNVFLTVICVLMAFRVLKNKYIMDIKDKTKTVFRRVPF
ncbi:ZP domain-containing protein [Caenorhabditis elegans]|uniref:ZP domain-containing protein n=3 Tax=Caenorhabditis elegans TaxID=6239 RepID=O16304_CAEEL|nr:ZP domain-containing protein [Caenorhabditis elegans]CCD69971.1 ZP domain-containing protein [Caenorhabditis elegans]|eukprot:NP_503385.3 CUTiclin-Like [Caenorhabditis elegans]